MGQGASWALWLPSHGATLAGVPGLRGTSRRGRISAAPTDLLSTALAPTVAWPKGQGAFRRGGKAGAKIRTLTWTPSTPAARMLTTTKSLCSVTVTVLHWWARRNFRPKLSSAQKPLLFLRGV